MFLLVRVVLARYSSVLDGEGGSREDNSAGIVAITLPNKNLSAEKLALSVAPDTATLMTLCWLPHIIVTRIKRTRDWSCVGEEMEVVGVVLEVVLGVVVEVVFKGGGVESPIVESNKCVEVEEKGGR